MVSFRAKLAELLHSEHAQTLAEHAPLALLALVSSSREWVNGWESFIKWGKRREEKIVPLLRYGSFLLKHVQILAYQDSQTRSVPDTYLEGQAFHQFGRGNLVEIGLDTLAERMHLFARDLEFTGLAQGRFAFGDTPQ